MNDKDLESLLKRLDESSFTSFEMTKGDFSLKIKKEVTQNVSVNAPTVVNSNNEVAKEDVIDDNIEEIKAPFVGVVYFTPSEGDAPYVEVGSKINKGDTIALIEAMKMFNEVHSSVNGEVVEVLVENGSMVEFDQPIIRVRK